MTVSKSIPIVPPLFSFYLTPLIPLAFKGEGEVFGRGASPLSGSPRVAPLILGGYGREAKPPLNPPCSAATLLYAPPPLIAGEASTPFYRCLLLPSPLSSPPLKRGV